MAYVVATSRSPLSHDLLGGSEKVRKNVGGVAVALEKAMRSFGGIWVCWGDGSMDYKYPEENLNGYALVRIFLTQKERHGFYDDYSNGTLWPLFHYFRDRIRHTRSGFRYYYEVNRKFAEKIAEVSGRDSRIWVHDYQLSMVPKLLREEGYRGKIVFTWHIPWVAREFFSILPESGHLLESLNSCDLITFHTEDYVRNFRESVTGILREKVIPRTKSIPLGIDVNYYSRKSHDEMVERPFENQKMIFSVDRLDYTKGLINRVYAVEELLRKHPDLRRRFVYVMVVNPSRTTVAEYAEMKRELEMVIGRVNGQHSDLRWRPIIYIYRKISDASLMRYYRQADVALITPLIDGLNLVAKEFVAASDHGVLVLSSFAGAARELGGALTVNPNDIEDVAEALFQAIQMPEEEIRSRLQQLKMTVKKHNLAWWIRAVDRSIR
ncbi:trehalose-6-phosphate synthase [Thermoplasmatales archaeon AK]|nr:trehalose-6-phosphate synthase [Thermoplasmatales archaeon AK]